MPIKSKYYASILRLVRVEDVQNPDNVVDPFYQEFEIGSYTKVMGIIVENPMEADAFCKQMTKHINVPYIYQIHELGDDELDGNDE